MEEIIISEIDFSDIDIFDEATAINFGNEKKAGVCYLKIKGNEGVIPHFHIESKTNNKFHTTIKIYEADYSGIHDDDIELTENQKSILNEAVTYDLWNDFREQWQNVNVNTDGQKKAFIGYLNKIGIKKEKDAIKPDYTLIS